MQIHSTRSAEGDPTPDRPVRLVATLVSVGVLAEMRERGLMFSGEPFEEIAFQSDALHVRHLDYILGREGVHVRELESGKVLSRLQQDPRVAIAEREAQDTSGRITPAATTDQINQRAPALPTIPSIELPSDAPSSAGDALIPPAQGQQAGQVARTAPPDPVTAAGVEATPLKPVD